MASSRWRKKRRIDGLAKHTRPPDLPGRDDSLGIPPMPGPRLDIKNGDRFIFCDPVIKRILVADRAAFWKTSHLEGRGGLENKSVPVFPF